MSQKRNWGYYIKSLREQKGLLRTQLSSASGVAYKHLERIENGRQKSPSPALIDNLARALGVAPLQIFELAYGFEPLPNRVPVYSKYPYQLGDEPVTYLNLSEPVSPDTMAFIAQADLSPVVHKGDRVVVAQSAPLEVGNLVSCLMDGRMELAKLRKVDGELWLEGKKFKIEYRKAQYVIRVLQLNLVEHLESMTLVIIAGIVGLSGLVAGLVQLIT